MNHWEKFNKTSLSEKEDFYRDLSMEDITRVDYTQAKRICKDFERKNLGEYRDLYVQGDTLLSADILRTLELAQQAALRKNKSKIRSL